MKKLILLMAATTFAASICAQVIAPRIMPDLLEKRESVGKSNARRLPTSAQDTMKISPTYMYSYYWGNYDNVSGDWFVGLCDADGNFLELDIISSSATTIVGSYTCDTAAYMKGTQGCGYVYVKIGSDTVLSNLGNVTIGYSRIKNDTIYYTFSGTITASNGTTVLLSCELPCWFSIDYQSYLYYYYDTQYGTNYGYTSFSQCEIVSGDVPKPNIYVCGTMESWGLADENYRMRTVTTDSVWAYDFGTTELVGQEFKINDGTWSGMDLGSSEAITSDGTISLMTSGNNISVDKQYSSATQCVVTLHLLASGSYTMSCTGTFLTGSRPMQDLYLRCDSNGWAALDEYKFTRDSIDENKWTLMLSLSSDLGGFKVADSIWGSYNFGTSSSTSMSLGIPYTLTNGSNNNLTLPSALGAGEYLFTLTQNEDVWTLTVEANCTAVDQFPWTENFDSLSTGIFSGFCWTNEHVSGSGSSLFKIATYSSSGNSTNLLQLPDQSSGTITRLVLPDWWINEAKRYQFSIEVYRNTNSTSYAGEGLRIYADTMELGFISRNYTVSDNKDVPAESSSGWYTYKFVIPNAGLQNIIIQGENKYGSSTYVDNLAVELAPTCLKPTDISVTDLTTHSAVIRWTSEAA